MTLKTTSGHHMRVCQFGTTHSQCRCLDRNKPVVQIECPTPDRCDPKLQTLGHPVPTRDELMDEALTLTSRNGGTIRASCHRGVWTVSLTVQRKPDLYTAPISTYRGRDRAFVTALQMALEASR